MKKDNTLKVLTHILGFFASWIAPLLILILTKDEDVKKHAKLALNWRISLFIYTLTIIFMLYVGYGLEILMTVIILLLITMDIIFTIIASVKASHDKLWTYPLAIPFLMNENKEIFILFFGITSTLFVWLINIPTLIPYISRSYLLIAMLSLFFLISFILILLCKNKKSLATISGIILSFLPAFFASSLIFLYNLNLVETGFILLIYFFILVLSFIVLLNLLIWNYKYKKIDIKDNKEKIILTTGFWSLFVFFSNINILNQEGSIYYVEFLSFFDNLNLGSFISMLLIFLFPLLGILFYIFNESKISKKAIIGLLLNIIALIGMIFFYYNLLVIPRL